MRLVFASDSLKGTLSSAEAGELLGRAAHERFPQVECACVPVADGGEGTLEALVAARGGRVVQVPVQGPLGDAVDARLALLDGPAAALEMSSASGLPLIEPPRRDPLLTSTYGTGELVRVALDAGARELVVGIGGSATNDGGMGALRALGVRFHDADGSELGGCGADLGRVAGFDAGGLDSRLACCRVRVMCDVDNPLLGPNGATRVFAAQKGASPEDVELLEAGMRNYARVLEEAFGQGCCEVPGSGAAGGLGAALRLFCHAEMVPGAECVLGEVGFDGLVAGADLCVTGEGRLDAQTLHGKAVAAVARHCRTAGVPCVALVGLADAAAGAEVAGRLGIARVFEVGASRASWDEAVAYAREDYLAAARAMFDELARGGVLGA